MHSHPFWHRALKLNKGIYKTTETVSDAEILKKQLREQANEILSTISVFCHRESAKLSPEVVPPPASGGPTSQHSLSASPKFQVSSFKFHDYYLPESEICLMLLLDKITVLKTFLFLAKEHGFFSEEKYQILAAACVHLSESAQSELSGAGIFSHPVFNSAEEVGLPPGFGSPTSKNSVHSASPEVEPPLEVLRHSSAGGADSQHSHSASPYSGHSGEFVNSSRVNPIGHTAQIPDNLSDILDNVSDTICENGENISDNLLDISNKKAENYISKSIKSRQNNSIISKFIGVIRKTQSDNNGRESLKNETSSVAALDDAVAVAVETRQIDFSSLPMESAPSQIDSSPFASSDLVIASREAAEQFSHSGHSGEFVDSGRLTIRQQKLYDFILQNNKARIGDLTALFPEKISEKTIRRDLQVLIDKSLVSQSGSRRWTQYFVYKKV